MKIAVFTDTYFPQVNGVVVCISDLVRMLSKKHDVVLFAPGGKRLRKERVSENFRIYWIPARPFPFYEGYKVSSMNYRRVSKLLEKEEPDIVHSHAPVVLGLQGMIAAKRKKIPVVVTYHTHFPDYVPHLLNGKLPEQFAKISNYTVKKMLKHAFKMADVVTAPTRELARELKTYGIPHAVYLPNGVELKKFKKDAKKGTAFRKRHGIGKTKKVVLYLGRVSFEKKLDVLLEAFKMIEAPDRVLVVAGGGPYLEEFKKLAKALGLDNIVFAGYLKNTAAAYSAADIFVSASDTETFGLTFVEAMHAKLPVIGVRKFGPKELIKDGRNGILVNPGDVAGLAGAMERLLSNDRLRKEMASKAYEISGEYSLEKSVEKTLRIYKRLAGGS